MSFADSGIGKSASFIIYTVLSYDGVYSVTGPTPPYNINFAGNTSYGLITGNATYQAYSFGASPDRYAYIFTAISYMGLNLSLGETTVNSSSSTDTQLKVTLNGTSTFTSCSLHMIMTKTS